MQVLTSTCAYTTLVKEATADVTQVLRRNCSDPSVHFEILSNPEFLAEGTAMADLENPDRVSTPTSHAQTHIIILPCKCASCQLYACLLSCTTLLLSDYMHRHACQPANVSVRLFTWCLYRHAFQMLHTMLPICCILTCQMVTGLSLMQVLIGGKETESGRRAVAVLKCVYQHWIPD